MFISVICLYICIICMSGASGFQKRALDPPGTGVFHVCNPPCSVGTEPCHLEKQPGLLTTEPSLQSLVLLFVIPGLFMFKHQT